MLPNDPLRNLHALDSLFSCLRIQPSTQRKEEGSTTVSTTEHANKPNNVRYWFRMFSRRKSVVAQPEPTEGQQRLAEQDFWCRSLRKQRNLNRITFLGVLAAIATLWFIYESITDADTAAKAAKKSADTAQTQLELSERPWVSAKIGIVKPLTFDSTKKGIMEIAGRFENVGQSVAISFLWWADVIPLDHNYGIATALARQAQWCKGNEFPQYPTKSNVAGDLLFPHDPKQQDTIITLLPEQVSKSLANPIFPGSEGRIAVAIVGCVVYRAPFDDNKTPNHQTTFMYFLASDGCSMPLFIPTGTPNLGLCLGWAGNSAK